MNHSLYYVYDPMCSWCYAFAPTLQSLKHTLPSHIKLIHVPGGLAPHTNEPMPKEMQEKIEAIWYQIEATVGTQFNHDFWRNCTPKRATYLACQATLAAKNQNQEEAMIQAIQEAYYQKAMNPSEEATLIHLAESLELDVQKFRDDLYAKETIEIFESMMNLRRKLHLNAFPSLAIQYKKEAYPIHIKYNDAPYIMQQIENLTNNVYF